jgi:hypothetical protein
METTKNRTAILGKVLRAVYIGVTLFHLLLWALNVKGQPVRYIHDSSSLSSGISANGLFNFQSGKAIEADDLRRRHVRDIYTSQIGVREKRPNSGPEVERYLRYVNLPKGNPWCAAFVCWVYGEARVSNPRTGWSPGLFGAGKVIWGAGEPRTKSHLEPRAKNQESRHLLDIPGGSVWGLASHCPLLSTPAAGDIFGLYFPEKGRIAHVGFIDEWNEPWLTTVEGNTNVLGSRDGDGVYRKRRLVKSVYKVARYL